MEFLGDAVHEMLVIGAVSSYFEIIQKGQITPNFLQKVKINFLSNNSMLKFFLFFHLDKFIQIEYTKENKNSQNLNFFNNKSNDFTMKTAIQKMKTVKTFAEFFEMELPNFKAPADIWESLAAAILFDGGMSALRNSILKLISPFLVYFVFHLAPKLKYYE
jgi:dsRNA-specific ribonuclease